MHHLIQLSGGVGSFIEASLCVEKFGAGNVSGLFADTLMEDPDLYRFLDESSSYLKIYVEKISYGLNPWEVFQKVKFVGNSRVDPCSRILKRDFLHNWITKNFLPEEVEIHLGIDFTEAHRLARAQKKRVPYKFRSLMVEQKLMLPPGEKIAYCRERNIEPPKLYLLGFPHNNCGGFCVKSGLAQFKLLFDTMPDRFDWHVERERDEKFEPKSTAIFAPREKRQNAVSMA